MKKIISVILVAIMLVSMIPVFSITGSAEAINPDTAWYTEHTEETNFEISTPAELLGFSKLIADKTTTFEGKTITLKNNITLNEGWSVGDSEAPTDKWANVTAGTHLDCFSGTFDGNGKTISGIYLDYTAGATGIFGNAKNATVKNLVILNSYVNGTWATGGIFGVTNGTNTIENVYADIYVTSNNAEVGGFIGRPGHESNNVTDTVRNCIFAGTVTTTETTKSIRVGGIIGGVISSGTSVQVTVDNCAVYGTVKATGGWDIGGILGTTLASTKVDIKNCIFGGDFIYIDNKAAGAIYGRKQGASSITVTNCVYTNITIAGAPKEDWACNGVANENCTHTTKAMLARILPSNLTGFTAVESCYPRPTTMVEMTADIIDLTGENAVIGNTQWYYGNTDATSYEIGTVDELLGFSQVLADGETFEGKTVKLTANVNLNPEWTAGMVAPEKVWADTTSKLFKGTFDGNGKSISGVYLKAKDGENAQTTGIFGGTGDGATVKNLVITNSYVEGSKDVGAIFGLGLNTKIDNIYCDVDIKTVNTDLARAGGLMGCSGQLNDMTSDTLTNCVYVGDITGVGTTRCMGGLVGMVYCSKLTLTNCAFYGSITANNQVIGGLFARTQNVLSEVEATNCVSAGAITVLGTDTDAVGAIYGQMYEYCQIKLYDCLYTKVTLGETPTDRAFPADEFNVPTADSTYEAIELDALKALDNEGLEAKALDNWVAVTNGNPLPTRVNSLLAGTVADEVSVVVGVASDDGETDGNEEAEDGNENTATDEEDDIDDAKKRKGCSSTALGGIAVIAVVSGMGVAFARKKKED